MSENSNLWHNVFLSILIVLCVGGLVANALYLNSTTIGILLIIGVFEFYTKLKWE